MNFLNLLTRMPSACAQGILWGIMALGVYITFRVLDIADLSVDGTFATGGAVTVMLIIAGKPAWLALIIAVLAGIAAGLCTGLLHTKLGIPAILSGILTQFALYSVNLHIMGMKANQTASLKKYGMFFDNGSGFLVSSRYIPQAILVGGILACLVIIALYLYFGTEQGSAIFFSTHVLDVAEKLCNKVAIIKQGKIVATGTMEEITEGHSLEERFLEAD